MVLSDRAETETRLVGMLDLQELVIDDEGRLVYDMPGDLASVRYSRMVDGELFDLTGNAEAWHAWRQLRVDLAMTRSIVKEHSGAHVTLSSDNIKATYCKEPPPSPVRRDRRTRTQTEHGEGSVSEETLAGNPASVQYKTLCQHMGVLENTQAHQLITLLVGGDDFSMPHSLPKDIGNKAYLGNMGGHALFSALAYGAEKADERGDPYNAKELRDLNLAGQGLGNEATESLGDFLPYCPNLTHLDLSRNQISETGAHYLAQAVMSHPALQTLRIDANPMPSWLRVRLRHQLEARRRELELAIGNMA